ncbi:MAG: tRNA lysidine(34) synthetase TilS, partial [Olsenella sp.]|nr:tRNA lysidine(34) synthetase TilS [Olsenella sp.]
MPSVARRYGPGGTGSTAPFERPSRATDDALLAPVVLMVSGGADSTALLVLAATSALDIEDGRGRARIARERLHVLHVNHRLRGIDADEDEEFVRDLAARYGIPCTIRRVNVAALAAASPDGNVENAGREVRYSEATRLANELSAQLGTPRSAARILTAHTANDRAETFVMNALRGTGASGLSSIPRRRNRVVRPLLDRTHDELCEFLRMRGIVWREDDTNADTHYLRAYVRHEVMPVLERRNPRVVASLSTTCDILSDEDAYLTAVAARTLRDLTRRTGEGALALDAARLSACEVAIARRVVRAAILEVCPDARLEARHIAQVLTLVAAGTGSASIPMGAEARVEYGLLFLRVRASETHDFSGWL